MLGGAILPEKPWPPQMGCQDGSGEPGDQSRYGSIALPWQDLKGSQTDAFTIALSVGLLGGWTKCL